MLDQHVDALAAPIRRFPNHTLYAGVDVAGYHAIGGPNTFIRLP